MVHRDDARLAPVEEDVLREEERRGERDDLHRDRRDEGDSQSQPADVRHPGPEAVTDERQVQRDRPGGAPVAARHDGETSLGDACRAAIAASTIAAASPAPVAAAASDLAREARRDAQGLRETTLNARRLCPVARSAARPSTPVEKDINVAADRDRLVEPPCVPAPNAGDYRGFVWNMRPMITAVGRVVRISSSTAAGGRSS